MRHGPAIVREHPVVRVVLTDRQPQHLVRGQFPIPTAFDGLPDESWLWMGEMASGPNRDLFTASILPEDLMDFGLRDLFATSQLADAALSDACLKWAKSQPA